MRKIILYINSTFNGIVTGDPDRDKDNFMVWTSEDFVKAGSECLLETMTSVDTILLGRKTYEALSRAEGWPSVKKWPGVNALTLALGDKINNAHKLVVTHDQAFDKLSWGEYRSAQRLAGADIEGQIRDLKNRQGGDIIIFGSPTLVRFLTDLNLIDEYQIQVRPVVVQVGEQLFDGLQQQKELQLIDVKPLAEGTLFIKYRPA
jgi:dihydrofolate reductase